MGLRILNKRNIDPKANAARQKLLDIEAQRWCEIASDAETHPPMEFFEKIESIRLRFKDDQKADNAAEKLEESIRHGDLNEISKTQKKITPKTLLDLL